MAQPPQPPKPPKPQPIGPPKIVGDPKTYVAWPQYTMSNPVILADFVQQIVKQCWEPWQNGKGKIKFQALKLHEVVSNIHKRLGIPPTRFIEQIIPINIKDAYFQEGYFMAHDWAISTRRGHEITTPKDFLRLAELVYHEGRHAEQSWLILVEYFFKKKFNNLHSLDLIKFSDPNLPDNSSFMWKAYFELVANRDIMNLALELASKRPKIPSNLSGEPLNKRQKFVQGLQKIYDAFYGRDKKKSEAILHELSNDHSHEIMSRYWNIPYEYDAHGTQVALREQLKRIKHFEKWVTEENLGIMPTHCKPLY